LDVESHRARNYGIQRLELKERYFVAYLNVDPLFRRNRIIMALSRKKKIIIGASALVVVILVVVISIAAGRKDEPEVTTVKVESRPELRSTVTASGEIRPIQFINLTSEVQGRIEEIYVKEGDQVQKGQPLIRLDPTQLQSSQQAQVAAAQASLGDVQNARANVASATQGLSVSQASVSQARQQLVASQTSVDRAQVDLNTAQRELKRTTELVENGITSKSEYDAARDRYEQAVVALKTAKANLDVQKESVNEAIARVSQQKAVVQQAESSVKTSESRATQQQAFLRGQSSQLSKATQMSPLTGVIADIPSKVGTFAVAGLSTTSLMTIADMSTINVEVKVDETEIANVEVGQPVKVKVDAFAEKEIVGTVTQKTPLALGKSATTGGLSNNINVQEAKEFRVVVQLKDLPQEIQSGLRPGMSATATITTKVKNNVIAVPLQSIVEKSPTPPGGSPTPAGGTPVPQKVGEKPKEIKGVYALEGNKVKFVPIETGITGESDIEILSGLQPNMEVITGPSRVLKTLKEGQTIKRQVKKPGDANTPAGGGK
jgi:HlyD family secretion protein